MNKFVIAAVALSVLRAPPLFAQGRLEGLSLLPDEVFIETDGPVEYKEFVLPNPPRLVIDLKDTAAVSGGTLEGRGQWLKTARASQFRKSPRVARVVLDLKKAVGYSVAAVDNGIDIKLSDEASAAPRAAPPPRPHLPVAPAEDDLASGLFAFSAREEGWGLAALFLTLILLLGRLRAPPQPQPQQPPEPEAPFVPESSREMIEGLQENVNLLGRRISIIEKKVAGQGEAPPAQLRDPSLQKRLAEDVEGLKTVTRGIAKALQLPTSPL